MGRLFLVAASVLVSGTLFILALPPADMAPLGWFALAPLFAAVRGRGLAMGALASLAACMFAAYLSTTGIFYSWDRLEGDPGWHYVGFLLFGLAVVVVGGAVGEMRQLTALAVLMLAALAVLLEAALLLYLPAHLGLTQYRSPAMLQLAAFTGIWGVSFLVWLSNLSLAALPTLMPRQSRVAIACAACLVGLTLIWRWPNPTGPEENSVVSARGSGTVLAVLQTTTMDLSELAEMNREASRLGAALVVWPELSATSAAMGGDTESLRDLSADEAHAPFVTTFPDGAVPLPFNVAALFGGGMEFGRYKKRKPFGGESQMHQAGSDALAVTRTGGKLGLNICFDSCFPSVMRETAKIQGVDLIALPCMGPETPYGFVQAIHGAYTPFRSAELGVPIARGESSAFAMVTNAKGRIVAEAPPGYVGPLLARVELERRPTFYAWAGDWFLVVLAALFTSGAITSKRQRRGDHVQAHFTSAAVPPELEKCYPLEATHPSQLPIERDVMDRILSEHNCFSSWRTVH